MLPEPQLADFLPNPNIQKKHNSELTLNESKHASENGQGPRHCRCQVVHVRPLERVSITDGTLRSPGAFRIPKKDTFRVLSVTKTPDVYWAQKNAHLPENL